MRKNLPILAILALLLATTVFARPEAGQQQPAVLQLKKDYGEDANFTLSIYCFADGVTYLNIATVVNGNFISINAYDETGAGVDWFTQVASVGRFTFYKGDALRRRVAKYHQLKTEVIPADQLGVRNGADSFPKVTGQPTDVLNFLNGILSAWRAGQNDFAYTVEEGKKMANLIFSYPSEWQEFWKDHSANKKQSREQHQ